MNGIAGYAQVCESNQTKVLINEHCDLVKKIAYQLHARLPATIQINDLIQSGSVGLIEAAKHFKEDKNTQFKTFATIRIRGAMIDYLREYSEIPRAIYKNSQLIASAIEECEREKKGEAKAIDIAHKLNVSLDDYYQMLNETSSCYLLSLEDWDENEHKSSEVSYYNTLEFIEENDLHSKLKSLISDLPQQEQTVLALYLNEELNFKEVGYVLDISESRACQIYSQAVKRLRVRVKMQLQA